MRQAASFFGSQKQCPSPNQVSATFLLCTKRKSNARPISSTSGNSKFIKKIQRVVVFGIEHPKCKYVIDKDVKFYCKDPGPARNLPYSWLCSFYLILGTIPVSILFKGKQKIPFNLTVSKTHFLLLAE